MQLAKAPVMPEKPPTGTEAKEAQMDQGSGRYDHPVAQGVPGSREGRAGGSKGRKLGLAEGKGTADHGQSGAPQALGVAAEPNRFCRCGTTGRTEPQLWRKQPCRESSVICDHDGDEVYVRSLAL